MGAFWLEAYYPVGSVCAATARRMRYEIKITKTITSKHPCIQTFLNRVNHGDCIEVMNRMPAASIDICVTSPPYNIRNSTGSGLRNGSGGLWKNSGLLKGYAGDTESFTDDMPYRKYV